MLVRTRNTILVLFVILLCGLAARAQQTEDYRSDLRPYYEALELMAKDHFEPAREGFDAFLADNHNDYDEYAVNASYYRALASMELFHKDAEFLMEEFVLRHPESIWYGDAVLELGRYNFNRRDYDDALRWLEEINLRDLPKAEADEVVFKTGFSAFELEEFDKAKSSFYKLKDTDGPYSGPTNYYYGHIAYTEGNYQTALESFEKASSDENFKQVVPYYIAQIYHYQGKTKELIEYAVPLLESEKVQRYEEIALLVGNAFYVEEDYEKAVPYLEEYMAKKYNPTVEEAYRMGYAYYRTGEYKKAVDYFSKASKAESTLGQVATYQLADSYLRLGQKEYAQNAFKMASTQYYDTDITEDALFNYAKLAYELSYDPFHEAIQAFEKYLDTYPNSNRKDEAFEFLLKVHLATKNYRAALDALSEMKTLGPIEKEQYQLVAYNLGVDLLNKKDHEQAEKYFGLVKDYDVNPELTALADYWMGDMHYRTGDYEDAKKAYRRFLENSAAYGTDFFNLAHYNIGYCAFKAGEYTESLTAFRKFTSASQVDDRRKADAWLRIGDLHLVGKDYNRAVESYAKAIETDDANNDYALFQQAMAFGYADDFKRKAQKMAELLNSSPETSLAAAAYFELGNARFLENELTPALEAFNTTIENYPQSPYRKKALLQRGLVEYRLERYDEAIDTYKLVVDEYGVDAESQEAIATLKNIYLDLGRVDDYTKWLSNVPDYEVSPSEIDSLTYQSAENLVADGNCDKAMPAFKDYLTKFPKGLFTTHANYYLGECAFRKNDFDSALEAFENVAERPVGQFTEPALLAASSIRYRRENYEEALAHFSDLEEVADFPSNVLTARLGLMRTNFILGNYQASLNAIDKVLNDANLTDGNEVEARLYRARIHFTERDFDSAETDYEFLAKKTETESGAEAQFRLAQIAYSRDDLDGAEKLVFDLIKKFSTYDYWKVKSFILLADVYASRGDFFQAKATLTSVIENVKTPALVNEAEVKLEFITEKENEAIAAGDTIPAPDTLDYEDEYQELIEDE